MKLLTGQEPHVVNKGNLSPVPSHDQICESQGRSFDSSAPQVLFFVLGAVQRFYQGLYIVMGCRQQLTRPVPALQHANGGAAIVVAAGETPGKYHWLPLPHREVSNYVKDTAYVLDSPVNVESLKYGS